MVVGDAKKSGAASVAVDRGKRPALGLDVMYDVVSTAPAFLARSNVHNPTQSIADAMRFGRRYLELCCKSLVSRKFARRKLRQFARRSPLRVMVPNLSITAAKCPRKTRLRTGSSAITASEKHASEQQQTNRRRLRHHLVGKANGSRAETVVGPERRLPNIIIAAVDDAVAVAVGPQIVGGTERVAPDGVVRGIDDAVAVVVARGNDQRIERLRPLRSDRSNVWPSIDDFVVAVEAGEVDRAVGGRRPDPALASSRNRGG